MHNSRFFSDIVVVFEGRGETNKQIIALDCGSGTRSGSLSRHYTRLIKPMSIWILTDSVKVKISRLRCLGQPSLQTVVSVIRWREIERSSTYGLEDLASV